MTGLSLDAIVIGGGHAGAEAARAIARGGKRVGLVTMQKEAIGRMSCNPAIGGLAKGHLVREIDALGGLMAEATDRAGIQFKVLNRSKGPAVQGPRAQCDRDLYSAAVQTLLEQQPGITILEDTAREFRTTNQAITGVVLSSGVQVSCRAVVVTTGTFLHALMHSGEKKVVGGRWGEPSAEGLSDGLRKLGLRLGRLKTGTPPRILRDTVDYSRMEPQAGDEPPRPFSILTDRIDQPQVLCWITYTSEVAHEAIRANLHRAPMYSGQIASTGPRYCPSIEDKVVRFADKDRHHVFVEPEGLQNPWLYLNGISTSLPADVQETVVHSIPGLEHAVIARYGYAVEYDFVNPEQLDPSLQVRNVGGLFLAGQINGTSGYEEAAGQGLIAGINALQYLRNREPIVLTRDQAYLGVMIDDLVTLGTEEPYRMFTSRAEYRLLLGCDSVYERLSGTADALAILDAERRRRIEARARRLEAAMSAVDSIELSPDRETVAWLDTLDLPIAAQTPLPKLFSRPSFDLRRFLEATAARFPLLASVTSLPEEEKETVVSRYRYSGYIEKQEREARKNRDEAHMKIPGGFSYDRPGFSREIIEKFNRVRPVSLGQAARIPGVTPPAVSLLRLYIRNDSSGPSQSGAADPAPAV